MCVFGGLDTKLGFLNDLWCLYPDGVNPSEESFNSSVNRKWQHQPHSQLVSENAGWPHGLDGGGGGDGDDGGFGPGAAGGAGPGVAGDAGRRRDSPEPRLGSLVVNPLPKRTDAAGVFLDSVEGSRNEGSLWIYGGRRQYAVSGVHPPLDDVWVYDFGDWMWWAMRKPPARTLGVLGSGGVHVGSRRQCLVSPLSEHGTPACSSPPARAPAL